MSRRNIRASVIDGRGGRVRNLFAAARVSNVPRYSFLDVAENGVLSAPEAPSAAFTGLPATKVLTLHMDTPESWLVEPIRAAHDLDNLRLSDLGSEPELSAEFELEALLLTGSCTDAAARRRDQARTFLKFCQKHMNIYCS